MFFLFRSAFWIVLVSFAINGVAALPRIGERLPQSARESAAHVVAAVSAIPTYCAKHQRICDDVRGAVAFAGRKIAAAMQAMIEERPPKGAG